MGTVSKAEIVKEAAAKAGVTPTAAKAMLDAVLDAISAHAEAGDTIQFMGFGRFSVKARPARSGRNPATGLPVDIPESRKLTFKASAKKAA